MRMTTQPPKGIAWSKKEMKKANTGFPSQFQKVTIAAKTTDRAASNQYKFRRDVMNAVLSVNYKGKKIEFSPEYEAEKDIPADELHEHLARPSTERTRKLKAR